MDYARPGITEWWAATPDGLEQGFDVAAGGAEVRVDVVVDAPVRGDADALRLGGG